MSPGLLRKLRAVRRRLRIVPTLRCVVIGLAAKAASDFRLRFAILAFLAFPRPLCCGSCTTCSGRGCPFSLAVVRFLNLTQVLCLNAFDCLNQAVQVRG